MKVEVPLSVDQRHDKLIYRCLKCNEEFTLLNIFKDHLQTHFEVLKLTKYLIHNFKMALKIIYFSEH